MEARNESGKVKRDMTKLNRVVLASKGILFVLIAFFFVITLVYSIITWLFQLL